MNSQIPTAADLQGKRNPQLELTKLFLRLDEPERREFLADGRFAHPHYWQSVELTPALTRTQPQTEA